MTIGEKIALRRRNAGLSQETLAGQLGVSRQARQPAGKPTSPSPIRKKCSSCAASSASPPMICCWIKHRKLL